MGNRGRRTCWRESPQSRHPKRRKRCPHRARAGAGPAQGRPPSRRPSPPPPPVCQFRPPPPLSFLPPPSPLWTGAARLTPAPDHLSDRSPRRRAAPWPRTRPRRSGSPPPSPGNAPSPLGTPFPLLTGISHSPTPGSPPPPPSAPSAWRNSPSPTAPPARRGVPTGRAVRACGPTGLGPLPLAGWGGPAAGRRAAPSWPPPLTWRPPWIPPSPGGGPTSAPVARHGRCGGTAYGAPRRGAGRRSRRPRRRLRPRRRRWWSTWRG